MSPMAAKSTRAAVISKIVLGISVVGCLFYVQALMCRHSRSLSGAANVFGGGTLSGSLHALSGPDHLAALLPFVLGKQWHKGAYLGSIWGLGHGLTTSILGILGFYVKDSLLAYKLLPQLTSLADYAVGVTLIIIGVMGIHECRSEQNISIVAAPGEVENGEQNSVVAEVEKIQPADSSSVLITIFANGCFLGMSWDGLPSLAPTLALYSWQLLFAFLAAYCVGTVLTISVASGCIGESTKWLSTVISDDLPRRLALVSSICAIVIGVVWILQSLLKLIEVTGNETTSTLSWILCCTIALGSPIAIVGLIILTISRDAISMGLQASTIKDAESDLNSQNNDTVGETVRFRKHLGGLPVTRVSTPLTAVQIV